jgi:hypothetical protein
MDGGDRPPDWPTGQNRSCPQANRTFLATAEGQARAVSSPRVPAHLAVLKARLHATSITQSGGQRICLKRRPATKDDLSRFSN